MTIVKLYIGRPEKEHVYINLYLGIHKIKIIKCFFQEVSNTTVKSKIVFN